MGDARKWHVKFMSLRNTLCRRFGDRDVMMSDFDYTILEAKRLCADYVIVISIEFSSSVFMSFVSFLANEFHSAYECREVGRA